MSVAKALSRSLLLIPALFFAVSALGAGTEEKAKQLTPTFLKGGKVLSIVEAKNYFDGREAEFIDARSRDDFDEGHIHGAQPIEYLESSESAVDFDSSVDRFNLAQLPPNKGQTVVFYCSGTAGWKSYKAAVLAIEEGYRDVMWLREGFSGWESANYPVE